MPIISKKELHDLRTRVEIAEDIIMEDSLARQQQYLECLDTYGAFSKKVYENLQNVEPLSDEELDEHLQRALDAFMDSELFLFFELKDTVEILMKKSGWSDEWTGRLGFAYYLGLTEKSKEV